MSTPKPAWPFRPTRLNVFPVKRRQSRDRSTGRAKVVYRLRVEADGWQWQKSFERKGHADARRQRIADGHALGWWFDPATVDVVDPGATKASAEEPTVFSTTLEYVQAGWPSWKPNTRRHYVRYLSRARRWLLRPDAPQLDDILHRAVERFIDETSLRLVPTRLDGVVAYNEDVPADLFEAAEWLAEWSLPITAVDASAVRRLLARFDYFVPRHAADAPPPQSVRSKPSTREGMARHTKGWWNWLREGGHVSHDPFRAARRPAQKVASRDSSRTVDPDIVLSPGLLLQFAEHVAAAHSSGERWRLYVPLLGLEGLRPGEALALRRKCFELPADLNRTSVGWLIFDEQRPTSRSQRFMDPEDRDSFASPLKGRGHGEARRLPIFTPLVPHVRYHLDEYVANGPDALVFTGIRGGPLDPKWFAQTIWEPARAAFVQELRSSSTYPERVLRKLETLRRHDLRHAAASFWLRVPVSPKLAQKWGGWRDLSTFLDVYQGVLAGEEEKAIQLVGAHLADLDIASAYMKRA